VTCQTSEAGKRSQRGPRLSQAVSTLEKKEVTSQVQRRFWKGFVQKVRAWVVQKGRWGYGEHFPKIWCEGVGCEARRIKSSEGHGNRKIDGEEKNYKSGKKRV
jgi:hypothetical protein